METEHPGFLKFAAAQVVLLFIAHRLQIAHVNGYISILHLTHVQLSSKHQSLRRYLTYLTEILLKNPLVSAGTRNRDLPKSRLFENYFIEAPLSNHSSRWFHPVSVPAGNAHLNSEGSISTASLLELTG